jgi:hypothetical protein
MRDYDYTNFNSGNMLKMLDIGKEFKFLFWALLGMTCSILLYKKTNAKGSSKNNHVF